MEILTYIEKIEILSLIIGFVLGLIVGFYIRTYGNNKALTRVDIFATLVSIVWIATIFFGIDINLFFNIIGAMSCMHILGEKSAKTLLDFLLQYKGVKK